MATDRSKADAPVAAEGRVAQRRRAVMEQALDHAVDVMTEKGVGALTVVEVARRSGIRGPSLYKYFSSLDHLYDSLFARGLTSQVAAVRKAVDGAQPGVARLRVVADALVAWATENPALAQLLFWRVVPSFEPSTETLTRSRDDMADLRAELAEAVRRGELDARADSEDAMHLWTVLLSGVISQQLANDPGAAFADGRFSRLTQDAVNLFLTTYAPSTTTGGPHATAGQ